MIHGRILHSSGTAWAIISCDHHEKAAKFLCNWDREVSRYKNRFCLDDIALFIDKGRQPALTLLDQVLL
jgi:hypothetical protein